MGSQSQREPYWTFFEPFSGKFEAGNYHLSQSSIPLWLNFITCIISVDKIIGIKYLNSAFLSFVKPPLRNNKTYFN